MPESFPTTPRAPVTVRLCAVVIGLVGIVLATRTTLTSSAWVDRTFPGFLLLVNRVVPSIGLAHWSGSTVAGLYQSQVVAVNGVPVASAQQVYRPVAASPPGTPVSYRLQKRGVEREITVPSQRFAVRDWILLFGAYLLNGVVYLTSGLVVWVLRPHSPLSRAWRGTSQLARPRVRVLTLGTLFGIGLPGFLLMISAAVWGQVAMNVAAFTPFLFALSLAYAIVKHDLFEIDAMVKRGAYYLVLTGAVGTAYVVAVVLLNLVLSGNAVTASPAFPVFFTLVVLLVFNPLRTRLQAFVDRVFFRTAYDGARELAAVGRQLASTLQRERIVALVCDAVNHAIPNGPTRLFVREPDGRLTQNGGRGVPPALGPA